MQKITIFALHLDYGGIEKYISYFCKMFEKKYNIEIICTYKMNSTPAFEFSKNINIKYLIESNPRDVSLKDLLKKGKICSALKELIKRIKIKSEAYKKNKEEAIKLDSDFVLTTREYHNKIVNKYAPNKIIKIATEHNYHNNDKKYVKKLVDSVTNFDYFVISTNELYDYYKNKVKPRCVLISNPVIIENDSKSKLNNKNIISVGRLSPEKGFEDLLDVMKIINNIDSEIKLTIAGDGYLRDKIENKIADLGIEENVKLTGFINGKKLEKAYSNASLYVMPSISECFGLVLLEAMHYGLPCISFDDASGPREILSNGTGILIENRDKEKMAKEIIKLFNNKELLNKYSKNSLKKVNEYSTDKITKVWEKEILNNN